MTADRTNGAVAAPDASAAGLPAGSKSELPYMTVVVAEELAIAEDLGNEELGARYRLMLKLWRAGGYLPEEKLVAASRAGRRWGALKAALLEHITVAAGKFSIGTVLIGLESVRRRRGARVDRALKAAEARWHFTRAHEESKIKAKPISERHAVMVSDVLLNSDKSLKSLDPSMLGASVEQCLPMPNQIQIDIDYKNISYDGAAAGSPGGGTSGTAAGLAEDRTSGGAGTLTARHEGLLYGSGVELVRERVSPNRLVAHAHVTAWLSRVRDAERLIALLATAAVERGAEGRLRGKEFLDFVEEQVAEFELPAAAEDDSAAAVHSAVDDGAAVAPVVHSAVDNTPQPATDRAAVEQAAAGEWLKSRGRALLISFGKHPGWVDTRIERLVRDCDGHQVAAASIVQAASSRARDAERLFALIDDGVVQYRKQRDGAQLPLMVPIAAGRPPPQAAATATRDAAPPDQAPAPAMLPKAANG